MTGAKPLILERLKQAGTWLAIHEMKVFGYSENCVASRLPELAKDGLVESRYRENENFKEWRIKESVAFDDSGQALMFEEVA